MNKFGDTTMPVKSHQIQAEELPQEILNRFHIKPQQIVTITVNIEEEPFKDIEFTKNKPKKSKWAKFAERISKESPLNGAGEELIQASKLFREGCGFKESQLIK